MQFKATTTIYEQIAGMIEDNILSGELAEGDRLQSVRALAAEVQVNPNTVQRTFQTLQDSELIANQRGIGYFVAEGAQKRILQARRRLFETEVLPEQFRHLALLGFTPEEIKSLYASYLAEHALPA
ncbi:MAG: GntR family transcriptional regulator [Saprospiraceae bacterium]